MISEKQLEANRNNALLSHGPLTDAGRKRSSMNAMRHGLTGQVAPMTDEDRTAHEKFSKALIQDLAPKGAMETQLAQRIATDSWHRHFDKAVMPYPRNALAEVNACGQRISAVEDNLFALGIHEHGRKLHLEHEQIDAAMTAARVYKQRPNRAIQKKLAILQELQATRKAGHESAMKEAATLLKLSEMRGMEYAPAKNGFVFSTTEIHTAIDRQHRLDSAATTDFTRYKPRKFQTQAAA